MSIRSSSGPVHCAYRPSFLPPVGNVEHATWAFLTTTTSQGEDETLPNLVTACASTLSVFTIDPRSHECHIVARCTVAETIVSLHTLPCKDGQQTDQLLVGFSGIPRLSIVSFKRNQQKAGYILEASAILDLRNCCSQEDEGATSWHEQDLYCVVSSSLQNANQTNSSTSTGVVIVGGGVALVAFDILQGELVPPVNTKSCNDKTKVLGCYTSEPYILPLRALSEHFPGSTQATSGTTAQHIKTANISSGVLLDAKHTDTSLNLFAAAANKSISTGWGELLDICFLEGYSTPTVAVLHGYQTASGRMAGGAIQSQLFSATSKALKYLAITAISITTSQKRSVLLWHCTKIPVDTATIHYCNFHDGGGAILAISPNVICCIDPSVGQLKAALAVNGFAHVSCSFDIQPNPSPLPRLSIQLDGSRFLALSSPSRNSKQLFRNQSSICSLIGIIVLRNGRMYGLQYHDSVTATLSSSILDYGLNNHQRDATGTYMAASTSCFLLALVPLEYKLPIGVKCLTSYQLAYHNNFNTKEDYDNIDEEKELLKVMFERHSGSTQTAEGRIDGYSCKDEAIDDEGKKLSLIEDFGIGYMFAGSNLGGNSQLLAYAFKTLPLSYEPLVPPQEQKQQGFSENAGYHYTAGSNVRKRKLEVDGDNDDSDQQHQVELNDTLEDGFKEENKQMERSSLFVGENERSPQHCETSIVSEDELEAEEHRLYNGVCPTSNSGEGAYADEDGTIKSLSFTIGGRKSIPSLSFLAFHLLDSIWGLGPLGYGCNGPAYTNTEITLGEDCTDAFNDDSSHANLLSQPNALVPFKDNALSVLPYGYGECGGIAVIQTGFGAGLTCSSEDICSEVDVLDVCGGGFVITTNESKIVVLPQKSGALFFHLTQGNNQGKVEESYLLEQFDHEHWFCNDDVNAIFHRCSIRSAVQVGLCFMALILEEPQEQPNPLRMVIVFDVKSPLSPCSIIKKFPLSSLNGSLLSVSVAESSFMTEKKMAVFCILYEKGGTVCTLKVVEDSSSTLVEFREEQLHPVEDDQIVAMDAFVCQSSLFFRSQNFMEQNVDESKWDNDDDDAYMYETASATKTRQTSNAFAGLIATVMKNNTLESSYVDNGFNTVHVAFCRASGKLEVYEYANLTVPVWQSTGAGSGCPTLSESSLKDETFVPCHSIVDMCFFFAGPARENLSKSPIKMRLFRPFCLALHTAKGDFHLYSLASHSFKLGPEFSRVPFTSATRPSSEEGRHRAKLYRRGILSNDTVAGIGTSQNSAFRYNSLIRFHDISGRDGLFSSTSRPFWVLADRGMLFAVPHKMRHLAAGSPNPIKAFCSSVRGDAFVTVHERIGRVGSQRLTVFRGISSISSPETFLPGGGSCVTKVPFGVTVRRIIFLEDVAISSLTFPLFVMIISRDFEANQSHLNDDGLTPEERNKIKAEKEAEKTRRQVEADLAGVDHIEQEWVEEIERDDYFDVKIHLGGAPPIPKSTYEVWLVNGNGWKVLDRYELGECNKALSLLVVPLTEVVEDSKRAVGEEVSLNATFIAVGTGYVDQDGEDVSSKGKVILFEVCRRNVSDGDEEGEGKDATVTGITASINLVYEKDMLMGPVTSLSCLTCDNTTRLVVGAGAELTIEQWNGEKLTQVGFFHAHMHVLDVKIFKNFFLLSDAYDSMYFLVWRESDKSLTLLAKDYEPTTIYCAGMLSRGSSIAFVCHDERGNLQFFQYAPKDEASRGGNKLVCRADFHLGTQLVCFQSHWCKSSLLSSSATTSSSVTALRQQDPVLRRSDEDQRFGLNFGTIDGSFGAIIPVSEQVYWRLAAVRSVMSNAIDSHCALSTRAWRLYRRSFRRGGCQSIERAKGVLDGDLLLQFLELPLSLQEELASAVGSTVDLITDNLIELECNSIPN